MLVCFGNIKFNNRKSIEFIIELISIGFNQHLLSFGLIVMQFLLTVCILITKGKCEIIENNMIKLYMLLINITKLPIKVVEDLGSRLFMSPNVNIFL